jgi:hypothetical protein
MRRRSMTARRHGGVCAQEALPQGAQDIMPLLTSRSQTEGVLALVVPDGYARADSSHVI